MWVNKIRLGKTRENKVKKLLIWTKYNNIHIMCNTCEKYFKLMAMVKLLLAL